MNSTPTHDFNFSHAIRHALILFAASLSVLLGAQLCAIDMVHAQDKNTNVIDGKSADPNEEFNLPPNFDPNHRPKKTPRNIKVTLDFRKAQLQEVVKFYSSIMKKNFIISDSLQANKTVTILSPRPISIHEAYKAFLEALNMNGLTVVTVGSFLKIVDAKKASSQGNAINSVPNDARMATAIIPVENAPIDEIERVIKGFVTQDAKIVKYGNSLIITEKGSNLRRVRSLIRRLDKSDANNKVFVHKVLHAEATEIKSKIEEVFSIEGSKNNTRNTRNTRNKKNEQSSSVGDELDVQVSEIISDERTNQLIIVTNDRSFERINQMIELLDVPTAIGGQIHVKFLEYANAEDLAGTLSGLASNTNRSNPRRSSSSRRGTTGAQTAQLLQGDVQISSHKATNSLIVIANPRDYVALERVIGLLDRPRRQVWVEAVIMEINLDVTRNLDVGFNSGLAPDFKNFIPDDLTQNGFIKNTRGLGMGQSNFGDGFSKVLGSPGGALGLLGPTLTIPGIELTIPAFAMFLQATQTDSNINILSTPSLLTLDNEESEIVVGDRIPFPRATAGGAGGLANVAGLLGGGSNAASQASSALGLLGGGLLNQVEYEDVGLTLRIRPQVNQSKYVRLEVNQEVSSVGASTDLGPTRSKRSIKTIVLVRDQSTVVIGGLIRDDENESETKVPFLGDIPLIGVLFRNTTTIKKKQNLVLMITPYIIESEADVKKILERKKAERQELLKLFQRRNNTYIKHTNYDKKSGLLDRMRTRINTSTREHIARQEALKAFEEDGPRFRILGESKDGESKDGESKNEVREKDSQKNQKNKAPK